LSSSFTKSEALWLEGMRPWRKQLGQRSYLESGVVALADVGVDLA
jgi:hypothetical protein